MRLFVKKNLAYIVCAPICINFLTNLYLKPQESDTPVYENEKAVKAEHCSGHKRFRKSCPICQEIVA